FANSVQYLTTREARKHEVKDDKVVLIRLGEIPASSSVAGHIDGEALGGQPLHDKSGDFLLVFNHQNPHRCSRHRVLLLVSPPVSARSSEHQPPSAELSQLRPCGSCHL